MEKTTITELLLQQLSEDGFARINRMLHADIPNINTIGIMTAENPNKQSLPAHENNKLNNSLENRLRGANYGFIKIKGKYGNPEKSFLIPNIERADLIQLGLEFDQQAVIFGYKDSGNDKMNFEYIEGNKVTNTRNVVLSSGDVGDTKDNFSLADGRKFIIPFFDDKYNISEQGKPYKIFDIDDEHNVYFQKSDLIINEKSQALIDEVFEETNSLIEGIDASGRFKWNRRGVIKSILNRLQEWKQS